MFKPFFEIRSLAGFIVLSVCLIGCASVPPQQLVDARNAYQRAAKGPTARESPAQLHSAQETLKLAEQTFEEDGDTSTTRDQAYMALRQTQLAEAHARMQHDQTTLAANKQRAEELRVAELERAQRQLAEEAARRKAADEELGRLAQVQQDSRGKVITLTGSELFQGEKAELLPDAQRRLTDIAKALNGSAPDAQLVIEGHSDTRGSATYNLELSAKRAEAVRTYLVSQGVASNRISAQGLGFSQRKTDSKTAEGRATNRRVEIVVQPATSGMGPSPSGI
jgi:outer membrane protein OmpA-like peptidoglycan-associated protein